MKYIKLLKSLKNIEKILEKSGKFVNQKMWEPNILFCMVEFTITNAVAIAQCEWTLTQWEGVPVGSFGINNG